MTEKRTKNNLWIFSLIFAYTIIFSTYTVIKHYAFKTWAWDLGIFVQSLSSTLQGKPFYYTVEMQTKHTTNFMSIHPSAIFFFILAIYAIYPHPETLLVLQSFILALGALPIYWMARDQFSDNRLALLLAILYLAYPPLHGVNCYDFHYEPFFSTFLLFALYYLKKKDWLKGGIFLVLAMLVMEWVQVITMFVGLYLIWIHRSEIISELKNRRWKSPYILVPTAIILSSLLILLSFLYIQKTLNPYHRPSDIIAITHTILSPKKILHGLRHDLNIKLYYLLSIFGPLAFIPLLEPIELVPSTPFFVSILLYTRKAQYQIGDQYPAFILPFVFSATIKALSKINLSKPTLIKLMAITTSIFVIMQSPLSTFAIGVYPPYVFGGAYATPCLTRNVILLHKVLDLVPDNATILTQNYIFPHVASRTGAYVVVNNLNLTLSLYDQLKKENLDYILLNLRNAHKTDIALAQYVIEDGEYGLFASADGILLFKKNYQGKPKLFIPYREDYGYQDLAILNGEINKKEKAIISKRGSPTGKIWYGPWCPLPPGRYRVTYRLKVSSTVPEKILKLQVVSQYGAIILSEKELNGSDFQKAGEWQDFTLEFTIQNVAIVEFIGICLSSTTDIYLSYIIVEQVETA